MAKRLLLHIGMHKTGTSAVQHALFDEKAALKKCGVNYIALDRNHSIPLYSLFAANPERYQIHKNAGHTISEITTLNAATNEAWLAYLSAITEQTAIISGEDLTCLPLINIEAFKAFLSPFFDTIKIVAYVRPPMSFMQSMAQEEIKHGACLEDVYFSPPLPEYRKRLEPYMQEFADENIELRPFAPSVFSDGDIVTDFLKLSNLPPLPERNKPRKISNKALTWPGVIYLDTLNRNLPLPANADARHKTTFDLIHEFTGPKFELNPMVIKEQLAKCEEDITWVSTMLAEDIKKFDIEFSDTPPTDPAISLLQQRAAAADYFVDHINRLHRPTGRAAQTIRSFIGEKLRKKR